MDKVSPIFVRPSAELRERLEGFRRETGMSRSEIVRRALDQFIGECPRGRSEEHLDLKP